MNLSQHIELSRDFVIDCFTAFNAVAGMGRQFEASPVYDGLLIRNHSIGGIPLAFNCKDHGIRNSFSIDRKGYNKFILFCPFQRVHESGSIRHSLVVATARDCACDITSASGNSSTKAIAISEPAGHLIHLERALNAVWIVFVFHFVSKFKQGILS